MDKVNNPEPASRIWVLYADKAGDNAQLTAIVEALGLPVTEKRVQFKARFSQGKPLFFASRRHVNPDVSDPLRPPWPDVILTTGRRPAMVALWVKRQSRQRTRVVLVGRPKRWLHVFDLIVAPVQYQLPHRPNVVPIGLPAIGIDTVRLTTARAAFADQIDSLARPLVALMVGGLTRPYALDKTVIREILARVAEYTRPAGTLYIVTSRRTPADVRRALHDDLPPGAVLYDWHEHTPNPYLALLDAADIVAVTADSVSMMTEAARAGRPLLVCDLPRRPDRVMRAVDWLLGGTRWERPTRWQRFCARLGIASFPRDLSAVHRWLYDQGLAAPLGAPPPVAPVPPEMELGRVVAGIRALLDHPDPHLIPATAEYSR